MKIFLVILILTASVAIFSFSHHSKKEYRNLYQSGVDKFRKSQQDLFQLIQNTDITDEKGRELLRERIHANRIELKKLDFWLRYFDPIAYRKLNGPLPVEWETEVFEKFEAPYKRTGAGLGLAEQYLDEPELRKDSLSGLIKTSIDSLHQFERDSVFIELNSYHHFYMANRLYLLNLAAIYTTGFECPDTLRIIPELKSMMPSIKTIYQNFNSAYPEHQVNQEYLELYDKAVEFVSGQSDNYSLFDNFIFIRDYINPLFKINQKFIRDYQVQSYNYNDYALSNDASSIFDKSLFLSQNTKGIFSFVDDERSLEEIRQTGKLLFYDPILSGNNKRSCASCHQPTSYFTDTTKSTAPMFEGKDHLPRNTPSLVNAVFNHLVMLDGKHISLQGQAREVMLNPIEMSNDEKEMVKKVLSCKTYKDAFKKYLKYTPEERNVSINHIVSAITLYYADFSKYYSPFDDAMNKHSAVNEDAKKGFNLFMSKAQCATCHFVPHFNGVKPPYIGSEFEVLGVPADTGFQKLSADQGRFIINPSGETDHAFRTSTVRNVEYTGPYMHNGVFKTLDQVIDFYDAGGGIGKKLQVSNQTLSSDSLKLSVDEKRQLKAFMHSLNENIIFETPPTKLPASSNKALNERKTGGEY